MKNWLKAFGIVVGLSVSVFFAIAGLHWLFNTNYGLIVFVVVLVFVFTYGFKDALDKGEKK